LEGEQVAARLLVELVDTGDDLDGRPQPGERIDEARHHGVADRLHEHAAVMVDDLA
jgi:hypothetical protein